MFNSGVISLGTLGVVLLTGAMAGYVVAKFPSFFVRVFTFLTSWNGYLFPLVMLQNTENYTLPVGLATIGTQYYQDYPAQAAAMILVSLPMILLYARFNKMVIQGMVQGAIKG